MLLRNTRLVHVDCALLRITVPAVSLTQHCCAMPHIKGGPWMASVQHSCRLTARLVRALTGHAPIGMYRYRFFHEPSHCMCGHPFEDVMHIIHICPHWSRVASPGARFRKKVFVKFLKDNPRAFEFPGANLEQTEEEGVAGYERGIPVHRVPHALREILAEMHLPRGPTPPPIVNMGPSRDPTSILVGMLPFFNTGELPGPRFIVTVYPSR
jgi:hypothetical protein